MFRDSQTYVNKHMLLLLKQHCIVALYCFLLINSWSVLTLLCHTHTGPPSVSQSRKMSSTLPRDKWVFLIYEWVILTTTVWYCVVNELSLKYNIYTQKFLNIFTLNKNSFRTTQLASSVLQEGAGSSLMAGLVVQLENKSALNAEMLFAKIS